MRASGNERPLYETLGAADKGNEVISSDGLINILLKSSACDRARTALIMRVSINFSRKRRVADISSELTALYSSATQSEYVISSYYMTVRF